ncbi:MAG: EcsC family protein [Lachnospiraceae bacterium]|nr:EcsC family protein [Lachnospiraceae bacterium]
MDGGRKEIRRLKTDAAGKRAAVTLGSAVEGIGLGVLGIGMPDIVIWLGILLRSIYETALEYGYNYESLEEKFFILKMMEASMQSGGAWVSVNEDVDDYLCQNAHVIPTEKELEEQIGKTASAFATDMLVMKFIQGIPIVGMIGGGANPIYYQKVMRYVQLKYRKRYLLSKNH